MRPISPIRPECARNSIPASSSARLIAIKLSAIGIRRTEQLLSRAWLLDPIETQIAAAVTSPKAAKEPWNGEYYVSFGQGKDRSWDDATKFGFVSAGGGSWYSNRLNLLKQNDRI